MVQSAWVFYMVCVREEGCEFGCGCECVEKRRGGEGRRERGCDIIFHESFSLGVEGRMGCEAVYR